MDIWCQKTAVAISNIAHPKLHRSAFSPVANPRCNWSWVFVLGLKFHPRQSHSFSAAYRGFNKKKRHCGIGFSAIDGFFARMLFFHPVLEGSTFWGPSISACSGFTFLSPGGGGFGPWFNVPYRCLGSSNCYGILQGDDDIWYQLQTMHLLQGIFGLIDDLSMFFLFDRFKHCTQILLHVWSPTEWVPFNDPWFYDMWCLQNKQHDSNLRIAEWSYWNPSYVLQLKRSQPSANIPFS